MFSKLRFFIHPATFFYSQIQIHFFVIKKQDDDKYYRKYKCDAGKIEGVHKHKQNGFAKKGGYKKLYSPTLHVPNAYKSDKL